MYNDIVILSIYDIFSFECRKNICCIAPLLEGKFSYCPGGGGTGWWSNKLYYPVTRLPPSLPLSRNNVWPGKLIREANLRDFETTAPKHSK